jgi:N-acetylmuramoyl-L-alanine amidase
MAVKAITLHAGHNPSGKIACGASDYLDESTEARALVKKITTYLKASGIKVYDVTCNNGTSQTDVLKKICSAANEKTRDLDVSIHFNACTHSKADGKTKGVEVVTVTGSTKTKTSTKYKAANGVCVNIHKLGFTNRGVKESSSLYFLNHTDKPAILIEVCFVDDQDDAKLYNANKDKVAKAIANAIASA